MYALGLATHKPQYIKEKFLVIGYATKQESFKESVIGEFRLPATWLQPFLR